MDILLSLGLSLHLGMQGPFNQVHPHVRLEHDGIIAGAYYNSEERISPYAGIRYDFSTNPNGVELGVVGNYSELDKIIPYVRYTYDINDNSRVFLAPSGERINGKIEYGVVVGIELLAF